jgi:hypothetical protein
MRINQELSGVIRLVNLIAIILIIIIHYHTRGFPGRFELNYLVQEFLHNIFARSAVPVFSLVSGFLFFHGGISTIDEFGRKFFRRVDTVFIPYLFVVTLIWLWAQLVWYWESGYGPVNSIRVILSSWLFYPKGSQFWFVRDLMFLFLASPYIYILIRRLGVIVPFILFLIWSVDLQVFPIFKDRYLLSNETLCFFVLGAYGALYLSEGALKTVLWPRPSIIMIVVFIYLALASLRIYVEPNMALWYKENNVLEHVLLQKIIICLGILLVFWLACFLNSTRYAKFLYRLSGYSFFVFLVHDYPLKNWLWDGLLAMGVSLSWIFYVRLIVAIILMIGLAIILELAFPRFFTWLSGGRNKRVEKPY